MDEPVKPVDIGPERRTLRDAILRVLPRKGEVRIDEVVATVMEEISTNSDKVWDEVRILVALGFLKAEEKNVDGKRFMYSLTEKGNESRVAAPPSEKVTSNRVEKFVHHKGKVPCPDCDGKNTAARVPTSTFPLIQCYCFDCKKIFPGKSDSLGARIAVAGTRGPHTLEKSGEGDEMGDEKKANRKKSKEAATKSVPAAKKTAVKEGGPSRYQMIRDFFKTRKTGTREELCKLTGWDEANVHTAMSILRTKKRSKGDKYLNTTWDKESGKYTRVD